MVIESLSLYQSNVLFKRKTLPNQSSPSSENISLDINLDFEENSQFLEGVISEAYQRLDISFFQEAQEFNDLINTSNLINIFFNQNKQT